MNIQNDDKRKTCVQCDNTFSMTTLNKPLSFSEEFHVCDVPMSHQAETLTFKDPPQEQFISVSSEEEVGI